MLGVSQPSNPPSSLRHSASFSCLQRSSNGETGHRARTSTLPQQPNVQLGSVAGHHHHHHHYGGPSSLQQNPSSLGSSSVRRLDGNIDVIQNPSENSNDYGFVRIRPRLRSTNSTVLREETESCSWKKKSSYSERENSSSCFGGGLESSSARSKQDSGSCDPEGSTSRSTETREALKSGGQQSGNPHQNPLRGALILLTTSTSSWWKAKQREELGTSSITSSSSSSGTTERKWSNGGGSAMTPPSSSSGIVNDGKWISNHHKSQPQHQQHTVGNAVGSTLSERKWSSKTGTVVSSAVNGKEDKWTSISGSSVSPSSTGQDRKWRSLGALLRTPVSASGAAATGGSQQHSSGRNADSGSASFPQSMSVSMIENGHLGNPVESSRECSTVGPSWKSVKYPSTSQPTSYSAGRPSWSDKASLRESGEFARPVRSGKVSRRLYQESANESPECRVESWEERRGANKTRGESSGDESGWKKKTTGGGSSSSRDCCQRSERQNGGGGAGRETSTRSSRAQSFYLLDDFLRPWQQPQSSSKCSLDLCVPSQYPRNGGNDRGARSIELANGGSNNGGPKSNQKQTNSSSSSGCNGQQQQRNNLTNITPPRRHNSSSDSLEVAGSPLPPPVPPPPPPEIGKREKERDPNIDQQNSFRDKDAAVSNASATASNATSNNSGSNNATSAPSCHCRMCWATFQQRSFRDEIPM